MHLFSLKRRFVFYFEDLFVASILGLRECAIWHSDHPVVAGSTTTYTIVLTATGFNIGSLFKMCAYLDLLSCLLLERWSIVFPCQHCSANHWMHLDLCWRRGRVFSSKWIRRPFLSPFNTGAFITVTAACSVSPLASGTLTVNTNAQLTVGAPPFASDVDTIISASLVGNE